MTEQTLRDPLFSDDKVCLKTPKKIVHSDSRTIRLGEQQGAGGE